MRFIFDPTDDKESYATTSSSAIAIECFGTSIKLSTPYGTGAIEVQQPNVEAFLSLLKIANEISYENLIEKEEEEEQHVLTITANIQEDQDEETKS